MVKYNYTVTIVAEDPRQVITRERGFDTLVDAVEYLDVKCTFYTRSAPYIAWSIELVDNKTCDTLFLLESR